MASFLGVDSEAGEENRLLVTPVQITAHSLGSVAGYQQALIAKKQELIL
jgi:hypothetical protein